MKDSTATASDTRDRGPHTRNIQEPEKRVPRLQAQRHNHPVRRPQHRERRDLPPMRTAPTGARNGSSSCAWSSRLWPLKSRFISSAATTAPTNMSVSNDDHKEVSMKGQVRHRALLQ